MASTPQDGRRGSGRTSRQHELTQYIVEHDSVSAADLAERFGVSLMTVHRDLAELEAQGVVRKYRGGVSAQPTSVFESNVAFRLRSSVREKHALARRALELVDAGMSVLLDDSTSALRVAEGLVHRSSLTVGTNFRPAIDLLSKAKDMRLFALGGEYSATHDSFLGVSCIEAVRSLHFDLLLCSTSAVTDGYAYHQEQEVVLLKRAMMESATRRVLLLDHTKLERTALHRVAPLSEFQLVLVDDGAPRELVDRLMSDSGTHVEVVPVAGAAE